MFIEEEIKTDVRPFVAVYAPNREFLYKYFDRAFNCRICDNPADADKKFPAFLCIGIGEEMDSYAQDFLDNCVKNDINVVILRLGLVVGTGMTGPTMQLARKIARGTLLKIRDNETQWSLIHATDVVKAGLLIAENIKEVKSEYILGGNPIGVNSLIDALSYRIKNKRIGFISQKWARILYGRKFYELVTTPINADSSNFKSQFPDFIFEDVPHYLTTHNYNEESL